MRSKNTCHGKADKISEAKVRERGQTEDVTKTADREGSQKTTGRRKMGIPPPQSLTKGGGASGILSEGSTAVGFISGGHQDVHGGCHTKKGGGSASSMCAISSEETKQGSKRGLGETMFFLLPGIGGEAEEEKGMKEATMTRSVRRGVRSL